MNKNIQMRRKVLPLHVFTHTPSFICADNVAPCRSRKVSGPQPGRNGQSEEVVASKLRLVRQVQQVQPARLVRQVQQVTPA